MKVYITKYALTNGILEVEAELTEFGDGASVIRVKGSKFHFALFHKPFWFESKEEAIVAAEKQKERKINSFKKRISELEEMTFQIPITKTNKGEHKNL